MFIREEEGDKRKLVVLDYGVIFLIYSWFFFGKGVYSVFKDLFYSFWE